MLVSSVRQVLLPAGISNVSTVQRPTPPALHPASAPWRSATLILTLDTAVDILSEVFCVIASVAVGGLF